MATANSWWEFSLLYTLNLLTATVDPFFPAPPVKIIVKLEYKANEDAKTIEKTGSNFISIDVEGIYRQKKQNKNIKQQQKEREKIKRAKITLENKLLKTIEIK